MYSAEIQNRLNKITSILKQLLNEIDVYGAPTVSQARLRLILNRAYALIFEESGNGFSDYILRERDRRKLLNLARDVQFWGYKFKNDLDENG